MKNFQENCIQHLMETILVIKQSIELLDENRKARTGALLGSQAFLLTDFLQKNREKPLVRNCAKRLEKQGKKQMKKMTQQMANDFEKMMKELRARDRERKEKEGDLRYVG